MRPRESFEALEEGGQRLRAGEAAGRPTPAGGSVSRALGTTSASYASQRDDHPISSARASSSQWSRLVGALLWAAAGSSAALLHHFLLFFPRGSNQAGVGQMSECFKNGRHLFLLITSDWADSPPTPSCGLCSEGQ